MINNYKSDSIKFHPKSYIKACKFLAVTHFNFMKFDKFLPQIKMIQLCWIASLKHKQILFSEVTAHGNHHWGKKKVQANPPIWGEMYILWQHNKPSDQIYPGLLSEKKREIQTAICIAFKEKKCD